MMVHEVHCPYNLRFNVSVLTLSAPHQPDVFSVQGKVPREVMEYVYLKRTSGKLIIPQSVLIKDVARI